MPVKSHRNMRPKKRTRQLFWKRVKGPLSRAQHHRYSGEREHGEGGVGKPLLVQLRSQLMKSSERIMYSFQKKSGEGVKGPEDYLE